MHKALSIVSAACLLIIMLCGSVELLAFNKPFYSAEYDKYEIPAAIRVEKANLMHVTDRLLAYMKGKAPDLAVETEVNGEAREFFNMREKDHMVDVKGLIMGGLYIRNACAVLLAASLAAMGFMRAPMIKALAWGIKRVFISFLVAAGAIAALVASNFGAAFNMFHEMFFNNDLWILDPATDLLVNIVPLGFFIDISAAICAVFCLLCLDAIVIAFVCSEAGVA